jgi:hypothetical protein
MPRALVLTAIQGDEEHVQAFCLAAVTVRSADHREGVQALLEKHKPIFGR